MGLLFQGTPLNWEDTKKFAEHVREHGIAQFLHIWDRLKDRDGDPLLWGDEIEYMVVAFDDSGKNAKLSLRQTEILEALANVVIDLCSNAPAKAGTVPTFHPEYGRYMLEGTPGSPYTGHLPDLLSVERNMRYRRQLIRAHLRSNEIPVTLTSFPRLGVQGVFTEPHFDPSNAKASHSLFLPDEITNPHVRFPTLTANFRRRRGAKNAANVPIFFDTNTPRPFIDPSIPWDRNVFREDSEAKNGAALQDHIYTDAMGFGMGCCCVQVTFQARNVEEARRAYDTLVPVAPIMLALTAASPAYRGYLADVDCRWDVISASMDERTDEERGLKPLKENKYRIHKSRYASVNSYISANFNNRPEYNDIPMPFNETAYAKLRDHGIDDLLAKHIGYLFIRDPLAIYSETLHQDDTVSTDHFENIQSTNWQTLRFKPPPPNTPIGWRVEFRPMEVQITDFENAALSVFVILLSRAILSFDINFYIPMSKVDENMSRAQTRNAAREQKFWFRKEIYPAHTPPLSHTNTPTQTPPWRAGEDDLGINGNARRAQSAGQPSVPHSAEHSRRPSPGASEPKPVDEEYEEMTVDEIINGKDAFPGLLGLVNAYLNSLDVEFEEKQRLHKYLDFVKRRANGSLLTTASWIRNFVRSHPAYKFDSVVSQEINYDLINTLDKIERGDLRADDLLPEDYVGGKIDNGCL
ncbi:hypothetical protein BOTBODRAFT_25566 [Botryobasidium botryosum FD-172 SS1]|uniref:Glutamate--cysteine ligase n=1 Tax=Botryobasidium botryosum (strain FD-172 SS1) TaxID=930990 RepID=A0A067MZU1_BOTB1|nr:hypothetical protein BOTBODRAFT_25566 [Botryobasidium botryosum FD-172 SS1]